MSSIETQHIAALLADVKASAIHELHRRLADQGFEGIRPSHGCVFRFIDPVQGSRLTGLAELAGMTKQALGEHVSDLEALGYVQRVPDASDGRAKIVCLTERGRASHAAALGVFSDIENEWAQRLGGDRMAQMRGMLEELAGARTPTAA